MSDKMNKFQTNFTEPESVRNCEVIASTSQKYSCAGCKKGVAMCYNMPCLGTVEDMEKIIDAGLGHKLMLDRWIGKKKASREDNPFEHDVYYLVGAVMNREGKQAPFNRGGKCTYLVDHKCTLHDLGLKPVLGKTACCKAPYPEVDERFDVLYTWNTQRGVDLIKRWQELVGFTEDDYEEEPTGIELMLGVLDFLDLREKNRKIMKEEGLLD